jgi:hypothetical protein
MKNIIFWDMTPCILLSCDRRCGGIYRLHLQGGRNNFSKNQQAIRWQAQYLPIMLADMGTAHIEKCTEKNSYHQCEFSIGYSVEGGKIWQEGNV